MTMTADRSGLLDGYLLIGDERLRVASGGEVAHISQITGEAQATIPLAGAAEMDTAVRRARAALPGWRALAPEARRDVLLKWAALVEAEENAATFTTMAALESGIPTMIGGGVGNFAAWVRYYAGWADKIHGELIRTPPASGLDYTLPEPYGVVGIIIPWNFPLVTIGMKVPPALAAGNTVVLKPPELAPFVALRLGELALEAGIPPGVLNVVPGGPEGGDALVRHPSVEKVSFTGSGRTATAIMKAAAESLTPLHFELGGKSANIVFADADLDKVAPMSAMMGIGFLVAGQGCVLPTRLLVQRAVYDDVVERVVATAQSIKVGNPLEATTMMGPVISAGAYERIMNVVAHARDRHDGELVIGGEPFEGDLASGFFVPPTVFRDVDNRSSLAQNEVFGPVLSIMAFDTEEEAVAMANDTTYGLGAYLHTADLSRAHRLAASLEAGVVSINDFRALSPETPFGGVKDSGFGREGGKAGLDEFLRYKNVYIAV